MEKLRALVSKHRQFLLYCVVGAVNTLITMAVLYGLFNKMQLNHGLSYAVAYAAGVVNGYYWSTKAVFRTRGTAVSLAKFVLVNLVTFAVNQALMWLFVDKLHLYSLLAQVVVTPFTFVANFSLNKLWTFARPGQVEGR